MFPIFRLLVRDVTATFDKSLVVIQLVLPLLFLFVAGYSYTNLIQPFHVNGVTINYQQFLAAGIILQTVMTGSLFAGLLLWIDRRLGMFEQILMGPFTRSQYAFSKILASMIVGLGGALIMLVFAAPFFLGFPLSLGGVLIALASIFLAALFFGSFAMVLTSMLKSNEAFNTVINLLFVVFTFVSSTFYPVDSAPKALQGLLLLNPLSYADDMLRLGLYGLTTSVVNYEILALCLETLIAFGLAVYTFQRIKITDR